MNATDLYGNKNKKTSWRRALVLAAGLAIVAGATGGNALARLTDDPPAAEEKGFDKPLGKKQAAHGKGGGAAAGGSSTMSMISDDGENRFELNVKNGEATAKMNGKDVPADRLVKTDAGYEIKDEAGKTLHTFNTDVRGGMRMLWNGGGAGGSAVEPPVAPSAPRVPVAPRAGTPRFRAIAPGATAIARTSTPKLMIGITMSDPEARLLKHLGAEDGIIIDSVRDGTPADKAGLKEEDVIIAIDDVKPVNQEKLRELSQAKKAGEQMKLSIVRDGKPMDLTLTLEKWDPKVMGDAAGAWIGSTNPYAGAFKGWGLNNDELKELLSSVEEELQSLKDNPELKAEALKARADEVAKTIQEALEKAIQSLKEAHEKLSDAATNGGFSMTLTPDADNTITLAPELWRSLKGGDADAQQERLEKMQEELERAMEKRQEALDREMEARQAALEKMQEQMERQMEKFQQQIERQREQAEREKSTR